MSSTKPAKFRLKFYLGWAETYDGDIIYSPITVGYREALADMLEPTRPMTRPPNSAPVTRKNKVSG